MVTYNWMFFGSCWLIFLVGSQISWWLGYMQIHRCYVSWYVSCTSCFLCLDRKKHEMGSQMVFRCFCVQPGSSCRPVREFEPPGPHQATLTKPGRPHIFDTGDSPDINACHCWHIQDIPRSHIQNDNTRWQVGTVLDPLGDFSVKTVSTWGRMTFRSKGCSSYAVTCIWRFQILQTEAVAKMFQWFFVLSNLM